MRLLFEPPPVYFMHLPKTGGSSLGRWLRAGYGSRYFDLDLPILPRFTVSELKVFRCYHSWHHGRSMFDLIGRADLPAITILRDPVERAVSVFHNRQRMMLNNLQQFTEDYQRQMRPILHREIQDCLDHDIVTQILNNGQTRLLGDRADYAVFLKHGAQAQPDRPFLRPYNIPRLIDPNDHAQLFANARAWLDEMAVVGLTERYAESLLMIGDLLGIPVPADLPRANANPQRTGPAMRYSDQLSPYVIARLRELNRYDLELYAHAEELFEQHWARYQAKPRRTYSIAPRLRISLHWAESRLKGWLLRTWPGLAEGVRDVRAAWKQEAGRR